MLPSALPLLLLQRCGHHRQGHCELWADAGVVLIIPAGHQQAAASQQQAAAGAARGAAVAVATGAAGCSSHATSGCCRVFAARVGAVHPRAWTGRLVFQHQRELCVLVAVEAQRDSCVCGGGAVPAAAGAHCPTWHPWALVVSPCCINLSRCSLSCADVRARRGSGMGGSGFECRPVVDCCGSVWSGFCSLMSATRWRNGL